MNRPDKTALVTCGLMLVLAFGLSAALYGRLPDPVPTHWNIHGQADGFTPKPWGPFVLPLIMIPLVLLLLALPRISPRGFRMDEFAGVYRWTVVVGMAGLLLAVHAVALAGALGHLSVVQTGVPAVLGAFFILLGNWLPKIRRNFFVGIRTPWTIADEEVWAKTHRFGGKTMVAAGLLTIALAALQAPFWLPVATILAGALAPAVASFFFWRSHEKADRPA